MSKIGILGFVCQPADVTSQDEAQAGWHAPCFSCCGAQFAQERVMYSTDRKVCLAGVALLDALGAGAPANAQEETIKVGVLHSLSGTMAISETTLKDVMLMLVEEQNAKGGLLGKKLEAVVVDPASNWPLFAEKARDLLAKDKVAAVFGCWHTMSRKLVLSV